MTVCQLVKKEESRAWIQKVNVQEELRVRLQSSNLGQSNPVFVYVYIDAYVDVVNIF